MKHNKKRNTAFIFETLIRELTKTIISKDNNKKKIILSLIKENFRGNGILARDLDLYKAILETRKVDKRTAEKIIFESRMQKKTINHRNLFEKQSEVIKKINKLVSPDVFANFIPNYKDMATIFQIFHPKTKTRQRVLMENDLVDRMISDEEKEKELLRPIDNLTYKTFVKRFNEKYKSSLMEAQKELLRRYIGSFEDNGIELKVFLNEEIPRLREELQRAMTLGELQSDSEMSAGAKKVSSMLENMAKRPVDNSFIHDVLKIQNLVKEIKS